MKFRVIDHAQDDFTIVTEDGGIVSVHHNGEHLVTTYYQNRMLPGTAPGMLWFELAEGKSYSKDWIEPATRSDIIKDALDWLVLPAPASWEHDPELWEEVLTTS